jgi:hypothetical protein
MVVRVATVAFEGIEARPVDVQVQIANGNVAFTVIDLHVDVPAIAAADLMLPPPAEGSREVAERVAAARDIQIARAMPGSVFRGSCPTPPRPPMSSRRSRNQMPGASP